jgi:hypothetical protein
MRGLRSKKLDKKDLNQLLFVITIRALALAVVMKESTLLYDSREKHPFKSGRRSLSLSPTEWA